MSEKAVREHHPYFAPSSAGRIAACRHSTEQIRRSGSDGVDTSGVGAERGTRLHRYSLDAALELDELESAFDRAAAHRAREWIEGVLTSYSLGEEDVIAVEHRVRVFSRSGEELTFGTVDLLAGREGELLVLDLKFHPTGAIPEDDAALQLMMYGIGALQEVQGNRVTCKLFAPHGPHEWSFEIDRNDLPKYIARAEKLEERSRPDPEAEVLDLTPGPHCQYCPALATCPAAAENAIAPRDAEGPLALRDGQYQILDDRLLAQQWAKVKAAEEHIKSFKAAVKEALVHDSSEYLELREKAGNRAFSGYAPVLDELPWGLQGYLTDEDIDELLKLSVSDLEGRFAERYYEAHEKQRGKKQEGVKLFREQIAPMVVHGEPSHSVQFRKGKAKDWR